MNPPPVSSHPSAEDWVALVYDELDPERSRVLQAHLEHCSTCRATVESWRQAMATLDTWRLPQAPRARVTLTPLRWAIAACLVLAMGLAAGRWTAPRVDLAQIRNELAPALRTELRAELQSQLLAASQVAQDHTDQRIADLARAWDAARQQDRETVVAYQQRSDRQTKAELANLRRDLETVAVNADVRLDTTQRSLGQLLTYSERTLNRPDATRPANNNLNE